MYFRQYWTDDRLVELFEQIVEATNQSSNSVTLGSDYLDLIWTPDIFWLDAIDVTKPGVVSESQSMTLDQNGSLFFSTRLLAEFRCEMKLKYFPFDIQQCTVCFESCQFQF